MPKAFSQLQAALYVEEAAHEATINLWTTLNWALGISVRTMPSIVSAVMVPFEVAIMVFPTSVLVNAQRCHRDPTVHGCLTSPTGTAAPIILGFVLSLQYCRCEVKFSAICVSSQLFAAASSFVANEDTCALISVRVGPNVVCNKNRAATL